MIGDMPVFAKCSDGRIVRAVFSNVRFVPDFSYTLLSVKQLWREQRVDARFRDLNHLELPKSAGGLALPYDPDVDLPTITLVSASQLHSGSPELAAKSAHFVHHMSLLGFHSTKSISPTDSSTSPNE